MDRPPQTETVLLLGRAKLALDVLAGHTLDSALRSKVIARPPRPPSDAVIFAVPHTISLRVDGDSLAWAGRKSFCIEM